MNYPLQFSKIVQGTCGRVNIPLGDETCPEPIDLNSSGRIAGCVSN